MGGDPMREFLTAVALIGGFMAWVHYTAMGIVYAWEGIRGRR
jgi:hypothetical protein